MPPQTSSDFELQLQNAMHDLDELGHDLGTDIFFLYSDANLPDVTNPEALHPRQMRDDLEKEGFKWFVFKPSVFHFSLCSLLKKGNHCTFCDTDHLM